MSSKLSHWVSFSDSDSGAQQRRSRLKKSKSGIDEGQISPRSPSKVFVTRFHSWIWSQIWSLEGRGGSSVEEEAENVTEEKATAKSITTAKVGE